MFSFHIYSNAEAAIFKLLKKLGINVDPDLISDELNKHPDYPSLLAISDVLNNFNIANDAFRVEFNEFAKLPCPFLVHTRMDGGNFMVVNKIEQDKILVSNDKWNNHSLKIEEFKFIYSGVVLAAERISPVSVSSPNPSVPNSLIIPALGVIFICALLQRSYFTALTWQAALITLFKMAGVLTSVLLLVQSINSNNPLIQRLCKSNGKKSDCNNILSSKAAKLFDWLSWSEVGFYYFTGTWLLILSGSGPAFITMILLVLNIISLPYTFYSIYYQARVAKQWCILCCTVQALLWLEFIPLLSVNWPLSFNITVDIKTVATILVCLLLPVVIWNILKPLLLKVQQLRPLKYQLQKFKYNSELFNKMLGTQPKYALPDESWSIVLGNVEANHIITMVSNPYCPPCSATHKLLDELLTHRSDIQARIVFTANNSDADIKTPVSRHMMALNELKDKSIVRKALHDWYEQKQKSYEAWAKVYPVELNEANYHKLDKQKAWCSMAEISGTPTLLLDGYQLPDQYRLSDLKYMLQ